MLRDQIRRSDKGLLYHFSPSWMCSCCISICDQQKQSWEGLLWSSLNLQPISFLAQLIQRLKWAFLIKICPLSVLVVLIVVVNFSHFQPNLAQNILGWRGFKFVQIKGPASFQGEIIAKNILTNLKNLLLQNHWANFNQTWHKASLGEGNSSLFYWRALPFFKGR